MTLYSRSSNRR